MFKGIWKKSLNNPLVLVLIVLIIGISLIAFSFYIPDDKNNFFLWISYSDWRKIVLTTATTFLSALVFKLLLTSTAVMKMVQKAIEDLLLESNFIEAYNENQLQKISEKVSQKSKFIEYSYNDKKIKSIYHAKQKYNENPNKKNFFIEDMIWIKTIYKNGNDIQNTIATLDITSSGNLDLIYELESDFNSSIYPDYKKFTTDRFTDYSFNVKITNYERKGNKLAKENYPKLSYPCIKEDKNKKIFKVCVEDCLAGDKFVIRISRTTLGEYTDDKVKKRRQEETKIATVDMKVPAGVRKIIFQEEIYGDDNQTRFKSNITSNGKSTHISPKEEESSFYITKKWEVFYDDHPNATIEFNIY